MEIRIYSGDMRFSKRNTRFTVFSGPVIAIIQKYVINYKN